MDFNSDIEARRQQLTRRDQELARQRNAERLQQERTLVQFNEFGKKFAQWARQSGAKSTTTKPENIPGAKPVQVGKGRKKYFSTPTREISVWVFASHYETDEHGWYSGTITVPDISIDENGEVWWNESHLGPRNAATLWDYIANFIAKSGSVVRWPE